MRLGFVLEQCLAPIPGGTGRYSRELARALVATAPAGASVHGFTAYHRDVTAAHVDGVGGPRRLPLERRALALAWERGVGPVPHGVDIVHAPTLLAPPRRRTPLVVTIHDVVPWTHPDTLTPRGVAFHRRMGERVARSADLVLADSHAVAAELTDVLDLAAERIRVVPLGVTDWPLDADRGAARRARLGLPQRYAVSLATMEPRKGLDVAVAALAEPPLREASTSDLALVVAGPAGWGGVDLSALAGRSGVAGRVHALGRLSDADLAAVLAGAVVLVQPSRAEGFGLPVVEAQALGVAVVATDVPALREVSGGWAEHVPVDDPHALAQAVAALLDDPARRSALAEGGLVNAARYTWTGAANAAWSAYVEAGG